MQKRVEKVHSHHAKASIHTSINVNYLYLAITTITFVAAFNGKMLLNDSFLMIQLVLTVPLFIYAISARSRLAITPTKKIERFGQYCYTLGFAAFLNAIGILIDHVSTIGIAMIYYATTIGLMMTYAFIIADTNKDGKVSLIRENIILICLVLFGILHLTGLY